MLEGEFLQDRKVGASPWKLIYNIEMDFYGTNSCSMNPLQYCSEVPYVCKDST